MFGLGPTELIVIAVIVILIFGAKRLPEVGKGLGGAIREFRNVKKEIISDTPEPVEQKKELTESPPADTSLEKKMVNKMVEQVPGMKQAMEIKKKADTIKGLLH